MSKKVRITQALLDKLECDGVAGLSRNESRVLERKGYLEKKQIHGTDGSVRYQYKVTSNIL